MSNDALQAVFDYTSASVQEGTGIDTRSTEYAELKRRVKEAGLLEKQPAYYITKFAITYTAYALGLLVLLTATNFWVLLLDAVYLGMVYAQIGMLGHDLGHRQIMRNARVIDLMGYLVGNLSMGFSQTWWVEKHNAHHAHPNEVDGDPDIDFPIMIFSPSQLKGKNRIQREIIKYQAYLFFPLLSLVSYNMRMHSIIVALTKPVKHRFLEIGSLVLHYVIYFALVFHALPFWQGIVFIVLHQAVFGFHMGAIFAPNHKGMPVIEPGQQLDFLRLQVLTARNIRAHPATDFLYGGLNYQIEHHLFPTTPRNKLGGVSVICKEFCREKGIPFYETGVFRSYVEIVQYLHEVSAPLRQGAQLQPET